MKSVLNRRYYVLNGLMYINPAQVLSSVYVPELLKTLVIPCQMSDAKQTVRL